MAVFGTGQRTRVYCTVENGRWARKRHQEARWEQRGLTAPRIQTIPTGSVVGRIPICCIEQYVCIHDEHGQRSIISYSASRFAILTRTRPVRNSGSGGNSVFLSRGRRSARRAASRLSSPIVTSLMFKVVFIWHTIQYIRIYANWHFSVRRTTEFNCSPDALPECVQHHQGLCVLQTPSYS